MDESVRKNFAKKLKISKVLLKIGNLKNRNPSYEKVSVWIKIFMNFWSLKEFVILYVLAKYYLVFLF